MDFTSFVDVSAILPRHDLTSLLSFDGLKPSKSIVDDYFNAFEECSP